jgi:hypothetical protein
MAGRNAPRMYFYPTEAKPLAGSDAGAVYYVKVVTRGANTRVKGSPRQAIDYITDGHDMRRDPGYSDAELAYVARMGDGWKTDLEHGRVPLVGLGSLRDESDEKRMAAELERACLPNGKRATAGYRSFTFTVPKEVSLFAEGHREDAKSAMYAAVQQALDGIYGDKHYTAVAAIHTRNENGEIHYHAHVLVGKFAQNRTTGKVYSLNSAAGGNTGHLQLARLKSLWKESLDREFKERLGLTIEQGTPNSAPTLVLPDGTRLESLSRASRRLLEKDLAPWYAVPGKSGVLVQRQLRLGAMDDRIFEVAAGDRGRSGWHPDAFRTTFPDQERFVARYEKRVETLKAIGYLTPEGRLTPEFRLHFALRHGINIPELQRIRIDLANQAARQANGADHPAPSGNDLRATAAVRGRLERLGLTANDFDRANRDIRSRRPTPEMLRSIRAEAARHVLSRSIRPLPRTKTIMRAYVDLQKARVQRVYLLVSGAVHLRLGESKRIADRLIKTAERDLFHAKEKRLAQLASGLRPIFWAVKVAMPRDARRLEKAVEQCSRLAYAQEIRRIEREEIRRAYLDWRKAFLDRPAPGARELYEKGYAALDRLARPEAALLRRWSGHEDDLVRAVYATARGSKTDAANSLTPDEYQAAVRAGQVGRLLVREKDAPGLEVAAGVDGNADLQRLHRRLHAFDIQSPLAPDRLATLAPTELRESLAAFRKAGLLDDGPAWTLKTGAARSLTPELARTLDRALDADHLLTDALLKRRQMS